MANSDWINKTVTYRKKEEEPDLYKRELGLLLGVSSLLKLAEII